MKSNKFKVVIADDSELLLAKIKMMLDAIDCMKIVGMAKNSDDAIALIDEFEPHCVIFDSGKTSSTFSGLLERTDQHKNLVIVDLDKLKQVLI